MSAHSANENSLPTSLSFKEAFLFPLQTADGRHDIFIGTVAILLLWPVGWILNLGARLDTVKRLHDGRPPYFRGMRPYTKTLQRGVISATAIFCYLSPAIILWLIAGLRHWSGDVTNLDILLALVGLGMFVLGVYTLPACMTVYACEGDPSVLRHPVRAFNRAAAQRLPYCKAWLIAISAILLSLLGLLFIGVGFVATSVWAWEVVGYAFTVAMYSSTQKNCSIGASHKM